MAQAGEILEYMREHGSISPMEAVKSINCYRLGARISDLRGRGYKIVTDMETRKNQKGEVKRYARYRLIEEESY